MTKQTKAKELVDKFFDCMPTLMLKGDNLSLSLAKQCALICVDEIMKVRFMDKDVEEYWQQVKQEIESL